MLMARRSLSLASFITYDSYDICFNGSESSGAHGFTQLTSLLLRVALRRLVLISPRIPNSLSLRMHRSKRVSSGVSAASLLCHSRRQVVARSRKSKTPAARIRILPYTGQSPVKGSVFAEIKARRTRDGFFLSCIPSHGLVALSRCTCTVICRSIRSP